MKHLRSLTEALVVLILVSWPGESLLACTPVHQDLRMARSFGCEGPFEPKVWTEFPLPKFPRIDLGSLPGSGVPPKKQAPAMKAVYSVGFRSENPTPPSCEVIKGRFLNHLEQVDNLAVITEKLRHKKNLTNQDLQDLQHQTRRYLPGIMDELDQNVLLSVVWKIERPAVIQPQDLITGEDFRKFSVWGPGLQWESMDSLHPDFFEIEIHPMEVHVSYKMSMMDFCFGENTLKLHGRKDPELFDEDPVLRARWTKDLLELHQFGFWDILTVGQLAELRK